MEEFVKELIERFEAESLENPDCKAIWTDKAINITKQLAEEYSHGHFGCNSNGEREKCAGCGIAPTCKEKYKHWFW